MRQESKPGGEVILYQTENGQTRLQVQLPGWFVKIAKKGNFPVKAMNANYLVQFLRGQSEIIQPPQVRRIITALDEKCRDVEF